MIKAIPYKCIIARGKKAIHCRLVKPTIQNNTTHYTATIPHNVVHTWYFNNTTHDIAMLQKRHTIWYCTIPHMIQNKTTHDNAIMLQQPHRIWYELHGSDGQDEFTCQQQNIRKIFKMRGIIAHIHWSLQWDTNCDLIDWLGQMFFCDLYGARRNKCFAKYKIFAISARLVGTTQDLTPSRI